VADTIRTFELIPPRGGWLHQALMTRCASSKRSQMNLSLPGAEGRNARGFKRFGADGSWL